MDNKNKLKTSISSLFALTLGLLSTLAFATAPEPDKERFSVQAGANRNTSDRPYLLYDHHIEGDQKLNDTLYYYINYVLAYQGFNQAVVEDTEAIYITYSFGQSEKADNEKCLQLTAFSRRVFDATKRIVPIWIASSCHVNNQHNDFELLPMYALSLRDVAGKNATLYQQQKAYSFDDELVKGIVKEINASLNP